MGPVKNSVFYFWIFFNETWHIFVDGHEHIIWMSHCNRPRNKRHYMYLYYGKCTGKHDLTLQNFYFCKTCAEILNFSLPKKLDLRKTKLICDQISQFLHHVLKHMRQNDRIRYSVVITRRHYLCLSYNRSEANVPFARATWHWNIVWLYMIILVENRIIMIWTNSIPRRWRHGAAMPIDHVRRSRGRIYEWGNESQSGAYL
jgi:hypothetical protein